MSSLDKEEIDLNIGDFYHGCGLNNDYFFCSDYEGRFVLKKYHLNNKNIDTIDIPGAMYRFTLAENLFYLNSQDNIYTFNPKIMN
jgi:hypothetical protein